MENSIFSTKISLFLKFSIAEISVEIVNKEEHFRLKDDDLQSSFEAKFENGGSAQSWCPHDIITCIWWALEDTPKPHRRQDLGVTSYFRKLHTTFLCKLCTQYRQFFSPWISIFKQLISTCTSHVATVPLPISLSCHTSTPTQCRLYRQRKTKFTEVADRKL